MKRLFQYLPMTESQVLQSTQALKALENTFPGKIPKSILSPVTNANGKDSVTYHPHVKKAKKTVVNKASTPKASTSKVSSKETAKKGMLLIVRFLFLKQSNN